MWNVNIYIDINIDRVLSYKYINMYLYTIFSYLNYTNLINLQHFSHIIGSFNLALLLNKIFIFTIVFYIISATISASFSQTIPTFFIL